MSYFRDFPKVIYDVKDNNKPHVMTDITKNIRMITDKYKHTTGFDFYDILDGDTPEMLAHKFYGKSTFHWIILITNNIINVHDDWPVQVNDLGGILSDKYDDDGGIHHYEIPQESGDVSTMIRIPTASLSEYPSANPISNLEYELDLQLAKRRIRILKPQFVSQFIEEFNAL